MTMNSKLARTFSLSLILLGVILSVPAGGQEKENSEQTRANEFCRQGAVLVVEKKQYAEAADAFEKCLATNLSDTERHAFAAGHLFKIYYHYRQFAKLETLHALKLKEHLDIAQYDLSFRDFYMASLYWLGHREFSRGNAKAASV